MCFRFILAKPFSLDLKEMLKGNHFQSHQLFTIKKEKRKPFTYRYVHNISIF